MEISKVINRNFRNMVSPYNSVIARSVRRDEAIPCFSKESASLWRLSATPRNDIV